MDEIAGPFFESAARRPPETTFPLARSRSRSPITMATPVEKITKLVDNARERIRTDAGARAAAIAAGGLATAALLRFILAPSEGRLNARQAGFAVAQPLTKSSRTFAVSRVTPRDANGAAETLAAGSAADPLLAVCGREVRRSASG
jgi:hypothetical protein